MKFHVAKLGAILFFSFIITSVPAQTFPDSIIKKIDGLFAKWNNVNGPGCSIGIVRNDSLIFSKGFGMANLEYEIPITPATIFYMCSVSKQFTGYCIVLLARQGKIKLDEDIHVYLPWVADFGKKITVRNLLNHTSGIRDDISLAAISGLGINGMLTQNLALDILRRQHSLNFEPGEEYSYSNSNFVLLAEIIKAVSGKSLRTFADSAIFRQLGMANTRFQDDYVDLIKNRAFSYERLDSNHYINDFQNIYTLGDGGLFTNIIDMAKWVTNFYITKAGDSSDINQLAEKGKLNNDKGIDYALGIVVDSYKGRKVYTHNGALAGYRTVICVFPDLKMGFLVFSNVGDFPPDTKAFAIANLFIKDTMQRMKPKLEQKDSSAAILKDTLALRKFLGNYTSVNDGQMSFEIHQGKLYNYNGNRIYVLIQTGKDSFSIFNRPEVKYIFSVKAKDTNLVITDPDRTSHFKKYKKIIPASDQELKPYCGIYYSPELDCNYGLALKNHHLTLTNNKYPDKECTFTDQNNLTTGFGAMNHLTILRNNKNQITGFEINDRGIRHLKFNKME